MSITTYLSKLSKEEKEELAAKVGSTLGHMKQLAGGHSVPGPNLAKKLAAATGIPRKDIRPDIWGDDEDAA